jgi:hypothetical protein
LLAIGKKMVLVDCLFNTSDSDYGACSENGDGVMMILSDVSNVLGDGESVMMMIRVLW